MTAVAVRPTSRLGCLALLEDRILLSLVHIAEDGAAHAQAPALAAAACQRCSGRPFTAVVAMDLSSSSTFCRRCLLEQVALEPQRWLRPLAA